MHIKTEDIGLKFETMHLLCFNNPIWSKLSSRFTAKSFIQYIKR